MPSPSRTHPPSALPARYRPLALPARHWLLVLPASYRLLALLLCGLLLMALGCGHLPHPPAQDHGPSSTTLTAPTALVAHGSRPATARVPRAETPPHSCSPADAHVEPVVLRPPGRIPVCADAVPATTATPTAVAAGREKPASPEPRGPASGRLKLCSLCRWRT
ncbi:hypothetical protein AB0J57_00350 [Streptomyces sp. NPDC049837]|uniref:hypothetical protein n=1 Tax=Streptomyces sp. NPDC049837 TaxID=3155277 RepID=UPI00341759D7